MSFELVLDHINTIRKDTDDILDTLKSHLKSCPSNPNDYGPSMSSLPFELEQNERNEIIELVHSITTRVSEINQELINRGYAQTP